MHRLNPFLITFECPAISARKIGLTQSIMLQHGYLALTQIKQDTECRLMQDLYFLPENINSPHYGYLYVRAHNPGDISDPIQFPGIGF